LCTFFTAGEKEVRAWTFHKGWKAPACAGVIHSDFENGFIRAEALSYADFEKYSSLNSAKDTGRLRTEGKDYEMQDGDIMLFLFNCISQSFSINKISFHSVEYRFYQPAIFPKIQVMRNRIIIFISHHISYLIFFHHLPISVVIKR
jgi:hypothetical protein